MYKEDEIVMKRQHEKYILREWLSSLKLGLDLIVEWKMQAKTSTCISCFYLTWYEMQGSFININITEMLQVMTSSNKVV